jgi:hypothetical protein
MVSSYAFKCKDFRNTRHTSNLCNTIVKLFLSRILNNSVEADGATTLLVGEISDNFCGYRG